MDANGANPVRLTSSGSINSSPDWSPDDAMIVFHSNRDGNEEIYVMKADGSNVTRLTNNPANDAFPAWHPGASP